MIVPRALPPAVVALIAECDAGRATVLGEAHATDLPVQLGLGALLRHTLRGGTTDAGPVSAAWFAEQALARVAESLHAPHGWSGLFAGSLVDATVRWLLPLRNASSELVLYRSTAAHDHVHEAAAVLGIDEVAVLADRRGAIVVDDLAAEINQRRGRPGVVVATIGTPWTGARDDLAAVRSVLRVAEQPCFLHVDAPLEGLPVELVAESGVVFPTGADSVLVAGDFLGVPLPAAFAVGRPGIWSPSIPVADRFGANAGHAAVLAWYAMHEFGAAGLARRARRADALAGYAVHRLTEVGWPAWRHPQSMIVVLRPPPLPVQQRWSLRVRDGRSRIVCAPGVTEAHIDRFVAEVSPDRRPEAAAPSRAVPLSVARNDAATDQRGHAAGAPPSSRS